jgi:hypothetical protein
MSFTDVFGGETIFPSQLSYNSIITAVDVVLQWPREQQIEGVNVVADWMDIDASVASLNIDMPTATSTSTGNKVTFNNIGANSFTVRDSTGGTIQSVAPGEQWLLILRDNTTAAGLWRTSQLGATVSVASAGALAGAGIKAITTTLNQKIDSDVEGATPFTVVDGDRAKCLVYTAGAGTCNLPSPGVVGNDWFFMLRNSGSGTLNVVPPSGVIDGGASINLDPNDSAFIFTDGTDFFTVGLSTGSTIAFDFVSIAIPGSGDFVLSGANLNRISYRFTGALTGNRRIVVPNTTQQYWVDNQTSGSFDLEIDTAAGAGQTIPQGESVIVYCDATDVINATSSTSISFPITIGQGGTNATDAATARGNLSAAFSGQDMIAGAGMVGGGTLAADRTFDVVAGIGLVVNANDIDVLQATETVLGGAEIATQAEADAGADDTLIITPLKLANFPIVTGSLGGLSDVTLTAPPTGAVLYKSAGDWLDGNSAIQVDPAGPITLQHNGVDTAQTATQVNGGLLANWSAGLEPVATITSGSFVADFSADFSGTVQRTVEWVKVSTFLISMVTLFLPTVTGTSNTQGFVSDASIPGSLRPIGGNLVQQIQYATDSGSRVLCRMTISSAIFEFFVGNDVASNSWTNTGTKGCDDINFTYQVA